MSKDTMIASAINLAEIQAHPSEALAALIQVVSLQGETIREHEMRLDKQSEYIRELRFKEEPELRPLQKDRCEVLRALLVLNQGKMLAKVARQKMQVSKTIFSRLLSNMKDEIEVRPFSANRREHLLILRSAKDG